MFKKSVLFATLLSGVMAFSTNADDKIILKHISVSSVSASPTVLEDTIADIARKYNASSWKVTSMRIDNNSTATFSFSVSEKSQIAKFSSIRC
ncbi:DUF1471 domain-containing protein [Escherichia coli]|nr:DUF1471 domain-containing protein [Escherichia coli]EHR6675441.1 DUF1471 domain-containing protein [Escherichia coli]